MTGPFVRRMFNLILRINSCHTSELLRHDSDTYSQIETGTEATEIHREKKVGYLRWRETDSGAAAARKKKKRLITWESLQSLPRTGLSGDKQVVSLECSRR